MAIRELDLEWACEFHDQLADFYRDYPWAGHDAKVLLLRLEQKIVQRLLQTHNCGLGVQTKVYSAMFSNRRKPYQKSEDMVATALNYAANFTHRRKAIP